MPSSIKSVLHTLASGLAAWLPLAHFSWLNLTVGGLIALILNFILSYTVPTTTGASAAPANHIGQ